MRVPTQLRTILVNQPGLAHVIPDERDRGEGDPEDTRIECPMPKLTVEGYGTFDVAENKRLVLAIEQDAKVDILHACGGNARCTTCRVEFSDGVPSKMTAAEKERLEQRGLTGLRLSCQIECDHDMNVRAISRLEGSGRPDPGRTPEQTIQPPPVWV